MNIKVAFVLLTALKISFLSADYVEDNTPCEILLDHNICYWTEVHDEWDMTYADARETCERRGSGLAVIRSGEDYDAIAKNLRSKIVPDWKNNVYAWIGNEFDPTNRLKNMIFVKEIGNHSC
ncbi:uncharacterized protein LOC120328392 isoform X1 [Styela clava]